MKPFEFLLKDLGWEKRLLSCEDGRCICNGHYGWESPDGEVFKMGAKPTYDFISQIEIEDWEEYSYHLFNLVPDNFIMGEFIHNAPLNGRILAHALARGYKEEKSDA